MRVGDRLQSLADVHLPLDGPLVVRLAADRSRLDRNYRSGSGVHAFVYPCEASSADLFDQVVMRRPEKHLARIRAALDTAARWLGRVTFRIEFVELTAHCLSHFLRRLHDEVVESGVVWPNQEEFRQSAREPLDYRAVSLSSGEPQPGTDGLRDVGCRAEGVLDLSEVIGLEAVTLSLLGGIERRDLPAGDDAVGSVNERRFEEKVWQPTNVIPAAGEEGRLAVAIPREGRGLDVDVRQK